VWLSPKKAIAAAGGCEDAGLGNFPGLIPISNVAASEAGLLLEREFTLFFRAL
jgi:hypothetical protein